jgi:hypothetical protein
VRAGAVALGIGVVVFEVGVEDVEVLHASPS